MNFLILSPFFPFLEDNGSKIRTMNVIKALKDHKIILVAFYEKKEEILNIEPEKFCSEFYYFKKLEISSITYFLNHFSFKPLLRLRFYRKDVYEFVKKVLKERKVDVVIIESLLMAEYGKKLERVYRIIDEHNIEFVRAKRRFENEKNILKKIYYFLIYWRLKRYELKVLKEFEASFVCSENDRFLIKKYLPHKEPVVIPNGVDVHFFHPKKKKDSNPRIVFLGTLWYEPNYDAVNFFIKEIFPLVKREVEKVEFLIIGEGSFRELEDYIEKNKLNIRFTGYVYDVRSYLEDATVFVAPIRMGSGTRFKILTAMAMGLPVVSTSVGCEGLKIRDGENICIADLPNDFARKTVRLIKDEKFREWIADNGRNLVETQYSTEATRECIENFFRDFNFRNW